jgi:hypothetical protein
VHTGVPGTEGVPPGTERAAGEARVPRLREFTRWTEFYDLCGSQVPAAIGFLATYRCSDGILMCIRELGIYCMVPYSVHIGTGSLPFTSDLCTDI